MRTLLAIIMSTAMITPVFADEEDGADITSVEVDRTKNFDQIMLNKRVEARSITILRDDSGKIVRFLITTKVGQTENCTSHISADGNGMLLKHVLKDCFPLGAGTH